MSWTNVPKPTGTSYTNVNDQGRHQYDDYAVMYDDIIFYDGVDQSMWTNVSKPVSSLWTNVPKPV